MTETVETKIIEEVTRLVEPVVEDLGLELVEVQFRREKVGKVLRVIIYHENGITVDDCTKVSREVSDQLDVVDVIEQSFQLEVSSPGLTRPLRNERDFARNMGKKVKIVLREKSITHIGTIAEAGPEAVGIETELGTIQFPYEHIAKAKLVIEF